MFAIPNGGRRQIREAVKLKAQGVTKGVWDIFVAIPSCGYHGLWIEFKAGKNKLTKEQKLFGENMREMGYATHVCYSVDEAIAALKEYLNDRKVFSGVSLCCGPYVS